MTTPHRISAMQPIHQPPCTIIPSELLMMVVMETRLTLPLFNEIFNEFILKRKLIMHEIDDGNANNKKNDGDEMNKMMTEIMHSHIHTFGKKGN